MNHTRTLLTAIASVFAATSVFADPAPENRKFFLLIGQLRTDLQADKVPVVMGEIHRGKSNDSINAALAVAAKKVPLCSLVSSEGLGRGLHFDSASARKFGQRYAAEYLKLAAEIESAPRK